MNRPIVVVDVARPPSVSTIDGLEGLQGMPMVCVTTRNSVERDEQRADDVEEQSASGLAPSSCRGLEQRAIDLLQAGEIDEHGGGRSSTTPS